MDQENVHFRIQDDIDQDKQYADEKRQTTNEQPVASYGLLYITRAHNRKEITFDDWLRLSKAWAEQVIRQYGKV